MVGEYSCPECLIPMAPYMSIGVHCLRCKAYFAYVDLQDIVLAWSGLTPQHTKFVPRAWAVTRGLEIVKW